jgi:hypothetical protein
MRSTGDVRAEFYSCTNAPQVKSRLDRDFRVPTLTTAAAGFLRCPSDDRLG